MELMLTCRTAPPLNLPSGLASVTVPVADAPWGMATALPAITSFATLPVKVSPGLLSLEPIEDPRLMVIAVPDGTTSGCFFASLRSCSLCSRASLPGDFSFESDGCVSLVAVSLELSLAGLLQAITANARSRQKKSSRPRERIDASKTLGNRKGNRALVTTRRSLERQSKVHQSEV